MQTRIDDYTTFCQYSYALDVGFPEIWINREPNDASTAMAERVKFGAKLLRKITHQQHSQALECVSIAVGFSTWHDLAAHLESIAVSTPNGVARESIGRLKETLAILTNPPLETSLSTDQILALELFGARLSACANVPLPAVLDTVCAGYCGNVSWKELTERSPLSARAPLYRFEPDSLDPDKTGRFTESYACSQLIDQLDDIYQDTTTEESITEAKIWIEHALARQPDFLEAGLCLAQIHYRRGRLSEAFRVVDAHIRKAERLIPTGYRGVIPWYCAENRFYLRMLNLRMEVNYDCGLMAECLRDARKQLRRDPSNVSVKATYPLLLLQCGAYEKAAIAARALRNQGDASYIICAFSCFTMNNYRGFIQNLTRALIDLPATRFFLANDSDELPDDSEMYRGVMPDMETLARYGLPAYESIPGLASACASYLAMTVVHDAERQLWEAWKASRAQTISVADLFALRLAWDALKLRLEQTILEELVG